AELHERDGRLATGQHLRVVAKPGEQLCRLADRCGSVVLEGGRNHRGPLGSTRLKGSCRTISLSLRVEKRTPRADTRTRGVHTRVLRSPDGSCRCFDGASREDLEQMALVLLGALEVGLDVDSVGSLLRRGLDGGGVERLA